MGQRPIIHVLKKADLRQGDPYRQWKDPEGIAPMTPAKVRTILDNPLSPDDSDTVQLIATMGELVIGRLDILRGQLLLGERTVDMYWASNLYVPEKHRHTMAGLILFVKLQQMHPCVGGAGPGRLAVPIYRKFGWLELSLPRFLLMRKSLPVVRRFLGDGLPARATGAACDVALACAHLALRACSLGALRGLQAVKTTQLCPGLVEVMARPRPDIARFHRSAAWVNWIQTQQVESVTRDSQGLYEVRGPDGGVKGYFQTKVRFYSTAQQGFKDLLLGSIADWCILDSREMSLPQLTLLASRELAAAGVDAVELCLPPGASAAGLRRLGFVRYGQMYHYVHGAKGGPLDDPRWRQPACWDVRLGEGDRFFF